MAAASICLALSFFAKLPCLRLKNHSLKNKVTKPGKVFQPGTVREFREVPGATGKGVENRTFTKSCGSWFTEEGRIKEYKQKGKI